MVHKLKIKRNKKETAIFIPGAVDIRDVYDIIRLFRADKFYSECVLYRDEYAEFERSCAISVLERHYDMNREILKFCFMSVSLHEILDIVEKFNTTLIIYSGVDISWTEFVPATIYSRYDICFAINDNDGSTLRFDPQKYDSNEIVDKIKFILAN